MIWKRYLLKELLKIFSLVLLSFYFLYTTLDFSLHMQDFVKDKQLQITDFLLYYGHLFVKRADLLIPLALLVATIKVLYHFNTHRELLALQVAGLKFKKLMRPLLLIGLLCTVFGYVSAEFIQPSSVTFLDNFHNSHFRHPTRIKNKQQILRREKIHIVPLKDRSKIIYQYYDKERSAYFDVIWIRSSEDIWRIKYLCSDMTGKYVDHFQRNDQGFMDKTESFESLALTQLKWDREKEQGAFTPFENHKISKLWQMAHKSWASSYERSEIWTNFFFKCAMPLLSLFVIIAIAPFCVRYSRTQRPFFTYAFALFGYITFYLIMNAAIILGENRVITPFLAIFTPFVLCSAPFIWKFTKTD